MSLRLITLIVLPLLATAADLAIPSVPGALTVDGRLDEPLWKSAAVLPFRSDRFTESLVKGGESRVVIAASSLCLSARVPEPDRIVALSLGRNPAFTREDLVSWKLTTSWKGRNRTLTLSVNPLGAYRIESNAGDEDGLLQVIATARLDRGEWTVEAAIPFDALGEIGFLSVSRVRVPRPEAPSLTWLWPAANQRASFELGKGSVKEQSAPVFRPAPAPARAAANRPSSAAATAPEPRRMLEKNVRARVDEAAFQERREWEKVRTLSDWERFREPRLAALKASFGKFPERTSLRAQVTRRADYGDGFVIENLVMESRPNLLVAANLYLPSKITGRIPAVVVVHSHHAPRTQSELQDMGMTWARAGVAVLVMDQLGAGERLQSQPWARESYFSRYALGMQLYLAGESLMKWMVWDLMRSIDYLSSQTFIDAKRIVIIGAVAGGGDPAAVTAALDDRVAAVVPFNFGEAGPEEHYTQLPRRYEAAVALPGSGSWESTRNLRLSTAGQFFPWFICASRAPRPFLFAMELAWPNGVEAEPAWARYRKVYDLYAKREQLDSVDGFGPFPGPGECTNVGAFLRQRIYPVLKRWLDIPIPAEEFSRPRSDDELMAITPAIAVERKPKPATALAAAIARERLATARANPAAIRDALRAKLGDIEPDRSAIARVTPGESTDAFVSEKITLEWRTGISLPLLLMRPVGRSATRLPVVLAFAQHGKKRFLSERTQEINKLIQAGIAVCLADVRGIDEGGQTGRTYRDMGLAATEFMLGTTLLGARVADARTMVHYLATRPDLDPNRLALWGDSFAPANPAGLALDKSQAQPAGPQIHEQAEPLGPLLALLTALYEERIVAVATHGGLVSFLSVLEDRFCYIPLDVVVPGILEVADISDIVKALGSRQVLFESMIDGRNRPVPISEVSRQFGSRVQVADYGSASEAGSWLARALAASKP